MKLIDKDALVAEIERLKADALLKKSQCKRSGLARIMCQIGAYNKILSFLNAIEVKEVDLKKEIDKWYNNEASKEFENVLYKDIEKCAKHFYDIGYFNGHIHDGDRIDHVDGRTVNVSRFRRVAKPLEAPVSEDLAYASEKYACRFSSSKYGHDKVKDAFIEGAYWQKEHLWKPADGDDLPEIDREVVAFQETFPTDVDVPSLLKIVISHRPNPEGYDGKSLTTGEVEHYTPKTYGKGGWNIPDVKYWLDIELPKEIEL